MSITVQVGKNGVSQGFLEHLDDACDAHDEVTISFLDSYRRSNNVDDGVERIHAYLDPLHDLTVERRGHTATLHVHE